MNGQRLQNCSSCAQVSKIKTNIRTQLNCFGKRFQVNQYFRPAYLQTHVTLQRLDLRKKETAAKSVHKYLSNRAKISILKVTTIRYKIPATVTYCSSLQLRIFSPVHCHLQQRKEAVYEDYTVHAFGRSISLHATCQAFSTGCMLLATIIS